MRRNIPGTVVGIRSQSLASLRNLLNPSLFLGRIVSKLGLPSDVAVLAERILRLARDGGITAGRNPVGLASAAVYYAIKIKGYKKTQNDVASSSGVTPLTVRNVCSYMARNLGFKDIEELKEMILEA